MRTRPHHAVRRFCLRAALCCAACTLAACQGDNSAGINPGDGSDPSAITGGPSQPIMPASIAIHPLSRIGSDASGKPAILLYLDIKDRFGQSIKALGVVRAEIYKPAGGVAAADGETQGTSDRVQAQDRAWNLDLRNADRNAKTFDDLVTRTYTIPLGGLPDWLIEWSKGIGNEPPTLRIEFTFIGTQGSETTLRAAQRLSR